MRDQSTTGRLGRHLGGRDQDEDHKSTWRQREQSGVRGDDGKTLAIEV